MALTDEQRGERPAWLRRHRKARYGSGDGGLAKLSGALRERGIDRSPTTIKGWEASEDRSPIPAEVLPVLEELFGEPAPRLSVPATTPELVAALRDQTAAISDLVDVLRVLVAAQIRSPEVEEAYRILDEAAASGVTEGLRRLHEDRAPLAPSPERLPRGTGASRG